MTRKMARARAHIGDRKDADMGRFNRNIMLALRTRIYRLAYYTHKKGKYAFLDRKDLLGRKLNTIKTSFYH